MPVNVISTIKPKNQGTFPVVEAVDVKVTDEKRLDAALNDKANQSDVTALQTAVNSKASQADLTNLSETVSGKAAQSDLDALSETVSDKADKSALAETNTALSSKANASDLAATNATVATKANASTVTSATANLQAQIDNIVTPVTQDAEVQNARVGTDSTSYTSLKERLDTEYSNQLLPFNKVSDETKDTAVDAITDFVIHLKDASQSVKLMLVYRNKSNVYAVQVKINGTNYNILNLTASNYSEKSYNEFDLGEIGYGYFVINWSALTTDTSYSNINAELKQIYKEDYNRVVSPFENVADDTGNTAVNAISDFVIHLKDTTKIVKLMLVYRNYQNVYAVTIKIDGTNYNILNLLNTDYSEKSYNEFDLGEIGYGYFVINWSALTTGTSYSNINAELKKEFKEEYFNAPPLPFESVESQANNVPIKAISDFTINLKDTSKSVKLTRVYRNFQSTYAVQVNIGGTNHNVLNVSSDNYVEKSYNEFDLGDDGYGYFVINWSAIPSNKSYNSIESELKQIFKNEFGPFYKDVSICIPDTIYVTVGKEISLEFYNIIKCTNIDEFQIDLSSTTTQIKNLGTRLRIAPTAAGTISETIKVIKNGFVVAAKSFQIVATADTKPTIKAIFLGDSMTNQGYYLSELKNMLGNNLTLYGTRSNTAADSNGTERTVLHEGRSSWSTSNYINDAEVNGVTNPFYNNGFDFGYYITNHPSYSDVTDVFILLGTNDGAGIGIETRYKAICDSIKDYNSSIRIHCMLPIPPVRDGYGFGTRNSYNYLTFKNYMFNTAMKIKTLYDGVSGYSVLPINANLNCWYDFPQVEVAVNSRNPQQVTVLNENVHPSPYGYYRFADVIYCDIIANCQ